MTMTRATLSLVAVLALTAACAGTKREMPRGPASIAGRVTAVQRSGERIGSIRVEERSADEAGSAKAVVRVTQSTVVFGPTETEMVDFNALRIGQWVRVWFVGPVRESYPVQADAGSIVIDSTAGPR